MGRAAAADDATTLYQLVHSSVQDERAGLEGATNRECFKLETFSLLLLLLLPVEVGLPTPVTRKTISQL